jgi:hypothetical protein
VEFSYAALQWLLLLRRYRRIGERIAADSNSRNYVDNALQASPNEGAMTDFVQVFADKIPQTYGAPSRRAGAA